MFFWVWRRLALAACSEARPDKDRRLWNTFENDMNQWHGLKWDYEIPSLSINFMDLTISIKDGKVAMRKKRRAGISICISLVTPPTRQVFWLA